MRLFLTIAMFVSSTLFIFSCKKEKAGGTVLVSMQSTTAPYNEVNVYVKELWANYSTEKSNSNWIKLETATGFYDLMDLTVLNDTLLVLGSKIPEAKHLTQLRFVFESDSNYVLKLGDVDSVHYPLQMTNLTTNGVKIQLNHELKSAAKMTLGLLFDTDPSITPLTGSMGQDSIYLLDPKITINYADVVE